MNEQDFRDALRHTMTAEAPPPMSDAPVLDAAHRDRGRRRAMLAGMGSAVAVAAIAVGVVVIGPSGDEGVQVGGPAVQTTDQAQQTGTPTSGTEDTKTSWPNGQTDRTATSGPQADRGVEVATALAGVIPAGYEAPDDLTGGDAASGTYPLKSHQAQYVDTVNGNEVWEYSARTPVTKDGGVGELSVTVTTPGPQAQPCDNTQPDIHCTEKTVGGKKVQLFDGTIAGRHIQTAVYRYEDGTSVAVAQDTEYAYSGQPALGGLPMTAEQLAALAVDSRFNID